MNLLKNKDYFAWTYCFFGLILIFSFYYNFQKETGAEIANWQRNCLFFEAFPRLKHAYTFEKDATTTAIDFCPEKLDGKIYGAKLSPDRFNFKESGLKFNFGSYIFLPRPPFYTNSDFTLHIWLKPTAFPQVKALILGQANEEDGFHSPSIFITRTLGKLVLKKSFLKTFLLIPCKKQKQCPLSL